MFGREVSSPSLSLVIGEPDEPGENTQMYHELVADRKEKFKNAYAATREQLGVVAERNKLHYDLKVKPFVFSVGQWVWHYCPRRRVGLNPKWQKLYSGPFLVTEIIGNVNVRLQKSSRSTNFI